MLHYSQVNGSILVARLPEEIPSLMQQAQALASVGIDAQWLDGGQLATQEPSLAAMAGGLRVMHDAQLVCGCVCVCVNVLVC